MSINGALDQIAGSAITQMTGAYGGLSMIHRLSSHLMGPMKGWNVSPAIENRLKMRSVYRQTALAVTRKTIYIAEGLGSFVNDATQPNHLVKK